MDRCFFKAKSPKLKGLDREIRFRSLPETRHQNEYPISQNGIAIVDEFIEELMDELAVLRRRLVKSHIFACGREDF